MTLGRTAASTEGAASCGGATMPSSKPKSGTLLRTETMPLASSTTVATQAPPVGEAEGGGCSSTVCARATGTATAAAAAEIAASADAVLRRAPVARRARSTGSGECGAMWACSRSAAAEPQRTLRARAARSMRQSTASARARPRGVRGGARACCDRLAPDAPGAGGRGEASARSSACGRGGDHNASGGRAHAARACAPRRATRVARTRPGGNNLKIRARSPTIGNVRLFIGWRLPRGPTPTPGNQLRCAHASLLGCLGYRLTQPRRVVGTDATRPPARPNGYRATTHLTGRWFFPSAWRGIRGQFCASGGRGGAFGSSEPGRRHTGFHLLTRFTRACSGASLTKPSCPFLRCGAAPRELRGACGPRAPRGPA